MKVIVRAVLLLFQALATPVTASDSAPDALLATVTAEVTDTIRQHRASADGNAKVADLIEKKVLPLFNFQHMTQLAMARNWRLATPEQQAALTAEFRKLLVRTYSSALWGYRDQKIEFRRLRAPPGATEVTVKSDVGNGRERMSIDYDMERTPAGWQIFDVKIDGVSLVTAYRETFAARVRAGGMDGLIRMLAEKNRQSDADIRPANTLHDRAHLLNGLVRSAFRHGG